MQAGGFIHSEQIFLTKELNKHKLCQEDQRLLYATLVGFFLVLCSRQIYRCNSMVCCGIASLSVFKNCIISRRKSLGTETLQSILKFDAFKD